MSKEYYLENRTGFPYVENRPEGPLNVPPNERVLVPSKEYAEAVVADSVSISHPKGQLRVVEVETVIHKASEPPTPPKKTSRR